MREGAISQRTQAQEEDVRKERSNEFDRKEKCGKRRPIVIAVIII